MTSALVLVLSRLIFDSKGNVRLSNCTGKYFIYFGKYMCVLIFTAMDTTNIISRFGNTIKIYVVHSEQF